MAKHKKKRVIKRKKHRHGNGILLSVIAMIYKAFPYILIITAVLFAGKLTISLLLDSSYFNIQKIEILSDGSPSASSVILKKLQSKKGNNIFRVDIKMSETVI